MSTPRQIGKSAFLLAIALAVAVTAEAQTGRFFGDYYDSLGYPGYYGDLGPRNYYYPLPGYYRFVPPAIENSKVIIPNRGVATSGRQATTTTLARTETFEELLEKAEVLFVDPDNIIPCARETRQIVRDKGQLADMSQIIEGGVYLAQHSHYPKAGRNGINKPRFADFCNQYVDWRRQGKSHQEAIAMIDEREKF